MGMREGIPGMSNHFDRGAAFYPLVMQYLASLHGTIELLSRYLASEADRMSPLDLEHQAAEPESFAKETLAWYLSDPSRRAVTQLFKRISLKSHLQEERTDVDPNELAAELFSESHYLLPWVARANGVLLILAYETCESSSDKSPVWEFLRHCRNAAAHGSAFRFVRDEPRRSAAWGKLTITRSMQGSPLFREGATGLLLMGDPVRLLWDLEQAYPGLSPDLGTDPA